MDNLYRNLQRQQKLIEEGETTKAEFYLFEPNDGEEGVLESLVEMFVSIAMSPKVQSISFTYSYLTSTAFFTSVLSKKQLSIMTIDLEDYPDYPLEPIMCQLADELRVSRVKALRLHYWTLPREEWGN